MFPWMGRGKSRLQQSQASLRCSSILAEGDERCFSRLLWMGFEPYLQMIRLRLPYETGRVLDCLGRAISPFCSRNGRVSVCRPVLAINSVHIALAYCTLLGLFTTAAWASFMERLVWPQCRGKGSVEASVLAPALHRANTPRLGVWCRPALGFD